MQPSFDPKRLDGWLISMLGAAKPQWQEPVNIRIDLFQAPAGEVIGRLNQLGMSPPIHTSSFKAYIPLERVAELSRQPFVRALWLVR